MIYIDLVILSMYGEVPIMRMDMPLQRSPRLKRTDGI